MKKLSLSYRALIAWFGVGVVMIAAIMFGVAHYLFEGDTVRHYRVERHLVRAKAYIATGNYTKAETEYRYALSVDAADADALGALGALYYGEGRVLPGYILLHRAVQIGTKDPAVQLAAGLSSFSLARTREARSAAKQVLTSEPSNEQALLLLANTSITERDAAETQHLVESLQARSPDAPGFHLALGAVWLGRRDEKRAEQEFRRALALDPTSGPADEGLGNLALRSGNMPQALSFFKLAAGESPARSPLRLKYARMLIATGAPNAARQELDEIVSAAPEYVPGWSMAMDLAASEHRDSDALDDAAKILKLDPANMMALSRRAQIRLNQGDVDGAISDLKVEENDFPHAPLIKYQLAIAYLRKNQNSAAEQSLHLALMLEPDYADAVLLLADLDTKRGDAASAIQALRDLLKREPGNRRARLLLAQAYREHGDFGRALTMLHVLAANSPNSPTNAYLYGMALFEDNRLGEAREQFQQAIRAYPAYWPAWEMIVNLDLASGRIRGAGSRLDELIKANPKAADPLMFRGRIRAADGDTAGAESDLQQAIVLDPGLQYAYVQLARIYLREGNPRGALKRLAAEAARAPGGRALMLTAMIHEDLGEYDDARKSYEGLLAQNPRFLPALNNLAALYSEKLGSTDKALELAQQAHDLAPDDPIVADTLGWALFQKGAFDSALPLLRRGAGNALAADAQYHLGVACYRLDMEPEARRALRAALVIGGDAPLVADAKTRLAILDVDATGAQSGARPLIQQRLQAIPDDPIARARLAAIELASGDARQAARDYEAALVLVPHSVPTMLALARVYAGTLVEPDRARNLIKKVQVAAPNDPGVSWSLGKLLFRTGDYAWSLDLLEQAAQGQTWQPELGFDVARAYYYTGRLPEAENNLREVLDDRSSFAQRSDAEALSWLISTAENPQQAAAAETRVHGLLERDPKAIPAWMVLGAARMQAKDYTGAKQAYQAALAVNPDFAPAMRELAILFAENLGDDVQAEAWGSKARAKFPEDGLLAYELGAIDYRKGDFLSAVRFLRDGLRARADDPECLFYLGLSDYQLKNSAAAREELEHALGLNLPIQEAEEAKRVLDDMSHGENGSGSG